MMSFDFITSLVMLYYFAVAGLVLYGLIVFIRLGHRGIKALDIYLSEKRGDRQ
ncbi:MULTISPECIES: hypothetical protein [unclassified Paenibacillus]|uniref:hypothetical protein n=2 Tax=Paenibacillus TaxID=44249 RepID=UPI0013E2CC8A|nr:MULTISPECIES: hypothetical protein [unclassified Paenibacillus]MCG7379078.1 hypothetical protein [Paenibacillus sp. ACRSA]